MNSDPRWNALGAASDELVAAMFTFSRADTPLNKARVERAIDVYVDRLEPVVGDVFAFRYHVSFHLFLESIERRQPLIAALAARGADAVDAELVGRLESDAAAAMQAFEAAEAAMLAQLEAAARGDGE